MDARWRRAGRQGRLRYHGGQESIEVGRKLAITGTPTIFFADGERITGVVPQAKIEQKLSESREPVK